MFSFFKAMFLITNCYLIMPYILHLKTSVEVAKRSDCFLVHVCNGLLSNCKIYVNIALLHNQKGNYNQLSVIVIKVYSVIKQTFAFVYIF